MPRSCSICVRSDAGAINALLHEGRSVLSVAKEFGASEDALQNHAHKKHQDRTPAAPRTKPGKDAVDPLDELVTALRNQALSGGAGNPAIVHQYRLALAAQSDAKHAAPPTRDLANEPEWLALREKLLAALEPYPAARLAIADVLT